MTCYISCILKSGTTLTSIFLDENCVNSRQCSFMTEGRYWTPIDPLATLKGVSRGLSKAKHAGDVTGPLLCVWFCVHIGYRGITILQKLSLNDSSISLCAWFCIHIGYRGYHDSSWVVSTWFVNFVLCVALYSHWLSLRDSSTLRCVWLCILIASYRGIMIFRKLSQRDSSNSLCSGSYSPL